LIQTAEGGMQEINNMVQRIRELVVQASNDTNDAPTLDREKIQGEITQLIDGINAMAGQVEFNAKKLLDGSLSTSGSASALGAVRGKLGAALGSAVTFDSATFGGYATNSGNQSALISLGFAAVPGTNAVLNANALAGVSALTAAATATNSAWVNEALGGNNTTIDGRIAVLDAMISINRANGVDTSLLDMQLSQMKNAKSIVADMAALISAGQDLLSGAVSGSLWFQTGSNSNQGIRTGIGGVSWDHMYTNNPNNTANPGALDVDNANGQDVSVFIDAVQNALDYVSSERAKLGAVQNRLEFTKQSLDISSENLSASESRIRDADMAKEMMRLTAQNVLQQAGVSMLAQANQAPQSVLQLLR